MREQPYPLDVTMAWGGGVSNHMSFINLIRSSYWLGRGIDEHFHQVVIGASDRKGDDTEHQITTRWPPRWRQNQRADTAYIHYITPSLEKGWAHSKPHSAQRVGNDCLSCL